MVVIVPAQRASAPAPREAVEQRLFDAAFRRGSIEALVGFLRRQPASPLVDAAVDRIRILLAAEFPGHRYAASMPRARLRRELLAAIREGRPALVAFASKEIRYREVWTWTTTFVELAGAAARIERMVPTVHTPRDGAFRAPGGTLDRPLEIEAFGRATHQWSCWAGPWRGSAVALNYLATSAADGRLVPVRCFARYPD